LQNDPTDRQPTDGPEPNTFEEAMGYLGRTRQQLAHANSELDKVRKEAAGYRTGTRGRVTRELSAMLGEPVADDAEPPSFDDLKPRLETALTATRAKDDRIRSLNLDLHLERAFSRHGAKGDVTRAFLDAQGHTKRLQALDPEREDFQAAIDDAVGEVLVGAPELRGSSSPARTSAPFRPPVPREQLSRADLKFLSPDEVVKAREAGLLDDVLGGPQGRR